MWPPPFFGDGARGCHSFPNDGRRLAFVGGERSRPRHVHLDAQVHSIEQRPGQLPEISPLGHRRADAVLRIRGRTRARVGGQHQLEPGRVARDAVTTGEPNLAFLQRSSQCFHRADTDLRTLIEEQHAPVRAADRSRPGQPRASADQRGDARGVVGRHERRPRDQRRVAGQQACHRVNRRHLQRLGLRQWRQQSRKPLGQHRFPDAGRPGHHQVMGAGRRDLDREPGVRLAHYIGEVKGILWRR